METELLALAETAGLSGVLLAGVAYAIRVIRKVDAWFGEAEKWVENLEKRLDPIEQALRGQEEDED